ncbi:hypothetical protein Rt10032_c12g4914 [Rhodotorula toruloides]|uniref:Uncharacterized protein n=1 Tax=Rhodotorula toruloides TaxID=5286 RepID=A0A511KKI7_RHOTO|nr:hypothetical protein Rt10032_c12g4914 [Rhodotorula toruloides]
MLSTLKHMERVLIDYEDGGREPWRRWLEDHDFRAQDLPRTEGRHLPPPPGARSFLPKLSTESFLMSCDTASPIRTFTISTALKVILAPNHRLPDAFKEELILCVAICLQLFRPHSTVWQNPAIVEAAAAAAHEWATPAKKRGKKSDWGTSLAFLKGTSVRKGRT